jgi:hypothetical protein
MMGRTMSCALSALLGEAALQEADICYFQAAIGSAE